MGAAFAVFGILKIVGFAGTAGYIAAVMGVGVGLAQVLAVVAIVAELGGGIALIVGKKLHIVSYLIAGYLAIVTLIFHRDIADQTQLTLLLKNILIIGGLLALCNCTNCGDCKKECCSA